MVVSGSTLRDHGPKTIGAAPAASPPEFRHRPDELLDDLRPEWPIASRRWRASCTGDNLPLLRELDDGSVQMVYADPPFNTGRTQARTTLATVAAANGDRTGFGGRRYATTLLARVLLPRRVRRLPRLPRAAAARAAPRAAPEGTLYLHLDYREAHYAKLLLDELFGRECFLNELIWAYDYGAKPRTPLAAEARHDPRLRARPASATCSTPRRSIASRTWPRAWSRPSSASAASGRRA